MSATPYIPGQQFILINYVTLTRKIDTTIKAPLHKSNDV